MALVEVKVPDIGDFKDVEIIELLVAPGDTVRLEQSLLTVESDKASMEIPSSHAGVVKELRVKLGDKVNQGVPVLLLETAGAGAAAPPVAVAMPVAAPQPSASVPAAPAIAALPVELRVPDIGDFAEVAVIEVLIKPGDRVRVEQSLITVESDKASMEIPSSHTGVVKEVRVKLGDKVAKGSVVALIETVGAAASPPLTTATLAPAMIAPATSHHALAPASPAAELATTEPAAIDANLAHASPSIRRLARELGVPLAEVVGSGPKGRISQDDVQDFVKRVMAGATQTRAQVQNQAGKVSSATAPGGAFPGLLPWPQLDFSKFGPVQRKDLSRIRKISGANLHRNWVLIPHVTNHDDADITELEAFRVRLNQENEKAGVKVTMLAFLIKAAVAALKKFPEFNASLDAEQLVLKEYFHIGFAADTPNGLMVPVIKDADTKGVLQISVEMSELAKKAREGKLSPTEMSGGCFSISSLGGIGGRYFTPIINAPEVAILGVCKSAMEPRWDGKAFVPRLMLPLSLSWDHRVIDGAAAARFNGYLGSVLADLRRVLL
ncbi:MAG: dihydrolipoyllysine-residue acetyltransferase [Burkholderiales bacterium]|jgi:pyruvate dehydrogenase E2 component (dihydrolipoamide acetyltransferase)|nr:dihydrolipoyllysine-residue acetyltransferase [Burkholderiales bacterium]